MKKVMFMINSLNGGGAEKVLQTLLANLDYRKYDVTLYSMHRENIAELDYPSQIHYKVVFDRYAGKNALWRRVREFAGKVKGKLFTIVPSKLFYTLFFHEKYDVEIAFIEGESTKIISGSTNRQSKKYAWVHIDLQQNPWTDFLYQSVEDERAHYEAFDKILCVSEATRKAFLHKYSVMPSKVCTHYNPIDVKYIMSKAEDVTYQFDKAVTHIVAVGRLVEQKGFDRLLEAAIALKADGLQFVIHIIGDGPCNSELQQFILEHGLEKNVRLYGYLKNPYPLMKSGDILVCSSRAEGYSLVVAEGIVLGLAIVTTDCSGPSELIGAGAYGILTENSTKGIYLGLKEIISNSDLLEKYKGLSYVRRNMFDIERNLKQIEGIIDS